MCCSAPDPETLLKIKGADSGFSNLVSDVRPASDSPFEMCAKPANVGTYTVPKTWYSGPTLEEILPTYTQTAGPCREPGNVGGDIGAAFEPKGENVTMT